MKSPLPASAARQNPLTSIRATGSDVEIRRTTTGLRVTLVSAAGQALGFVHCSRPSSITAAETMERAVAGRLHADCGLRLALETLARVAGAIG